MKILSSLVLFAAVGYGCGLAHAGVVVGGTRVIYDGAKKEASIGIDNPDASAYLIQSWVENEAGQNDKGSFVVTPPLFRLGGKEQNALRIMRAHPSLPDNRETLYWLNIKSIPASDPNQAQNTLQLAINTRIKLIYRPAALKGSSPEQASSQLKWSRQGQKLVVSNPTPYYINFHSISVGGRALEHATYVAPSATATFTLPVQAGGQQVEWKVISDYGATGAAQRAAL